MHIYQCFRHRVTVNAQLSVFLSQSYSKCTFISAFRTFAPCKQHGMVVFGNPFRIVYPSSDCIKSDRRANLSSVGGHQFIVFYKLCFRWCLK